MNTQENRQFPRIPHMSSRHIVHFDAKKAVKKDIILTENLSASGIKFTTNCDLKKGHYFLIDLHDQLMQEFQSLFADKHSWIKSGDYYLMQVVWSQEIEKNQDVFEIGAAFVQKDQCKMAEIETLTKLMSAQVIEELAPQIAATH